MIAMRDLLALLAAPDEPLERLDLAWFARFLASEPRRCGGRCACSFDGDRAMLGPKPQRLRNVNVHPRAARGS